MTMLPSSLVQVPAIRFCYDELSGLTFLIVYPRKVSVHQLEFPTLDHPGQVCHLAVSLIRRPNLESKVSTYEHSGGARIHALMPHPAQPRPAESSSCRSRVRNQLLQAEPSSLYVHGVAPRRNSNAELQFTPLLTNYTRASFDPPSPTRSSVCWLRRAFFTPASPRTSTHLSDRQVCQMTRLLRPMEALHRTTVSTARHHMTMTR